MAEAVSHLNDPVSAHARRDSPLLREEMTVDAALRLIREQGLAEKIIYFYVVDTDDRLVGVLPTRRFLVAAPEARVGDLMIKRVVAVPQHAKLLDACELFVLYKFFAFPVVDAERRVVGVLDISSFTEEVLDLAEPEKVADTFESLGFHVAQARGASAWKAFQLRFPWLLATIASGTAGALLAGFFEHTLARVVVVAFFLALVLALAEAISVQSMTLTLQALRAIKPNWSWFLKAVQRELGTALLLGGACGSVVFLIVWAWRRTPDAAAVIGGTVVGAACIACLSGVALPALLHALRLDPKIAAGPITLAVADVLTLLLYFSLASWLL
ncbi:MAG TPA: magnesium transporter [Chthoniobacteraceae bacterium]|jgi:magnesium transporter|nr:magnesium transporter [Chthoniobacteraceae bacterium]